ncbi:hypothetical protein [Nocardia salmonicida]|uniref:hypothetical protein n=1 Tax=Nocardia salmonicida TaxID=53431 RepID=UPI0033C250CA
MTDLRNPYKLFLTQSIPSKHRVFAIDQRRGSWDDLHAIATFEKRWEAVRLADALNELLTGTELAPQFVDEALETAPAPVRSQVNKIAEAITTSIYADQGRYLHALSRPSICGVMRFPLGPNGGVDLSADYDNDHPDFDLAFHSRPITPRTAEALRTEGAFLSDSIDEVGDQCLPPRLQGHGKPFRDRLIACFDSLVDDLEHGEVPKPRCNAEVIAWWMILQFAEETITEDGLISPSINDLPPSDYDYQFNQLRDDLYEDHEVLDFFIDTGNTTVFAEIVDGLFEPFLHPGPRQR